MRVGETHGLQCEFVCAQVQLAHIAVMSYFEPCVSAPRTLRTAFLAQSILLKMVYRGLWRRSRNENEKTSIPVRSSKESLPELKDQRRIAQWHEHNWSVERNVKPLTSDEVRSCSVAMPPAHTLEKQSIRYFIQKTYKPYFRCGHKANPNIKVFGQEDTCIIENCQGPDLKL